MDEAVDEENPEGVEGEGTAEDNWLLTIKLKYNKHKIRNI